MVCMEKGVVHIGKLESRVWSLHLWTCVHVSALLSLFYLYGCWDWCQFKPHKWWMIELSMSPEGTCQQAAYFRYGEIMFTVPWSLSGWALPPLL